MGCCSTNNESDNKQILFEIDNICNTCGSTANKVEYKTVLMILKNNSLQTAKPGNYFYCKNPDCNTVYFSNELGLSYYKNDVRIPIGIKETKEPKLICYCFDITEKQIKDEINLTGKSTAPDFITEKIKNKLCACNIKNPSCKCCLGDVKKVVASTARKIK